MLMVPQVYLGRPAARPFMLWPGGKRRLAQQIATHIPVGGFRDYYEPFLGAGSIYLAFQQWRKHGSHLSDINEDVINCWLTVKHDVDALLKLLRHHWRLGNDQTYFNEIRTQFDLTGTPRAARFIYLMQASHQGIYKPNKDGHFKPSYGYHDLRQLDERNFRRLSDHLQDTSIRLQSYEHIEPQPGDLVYCDPPYHETVIDYTGNQFDQHALHRVIMGWVQNGVHVIHSNSDTPLMRELYDGWTMTELQPVIMINSQVGQKKPKRDELIMSPPAG